MDYKTQFIKNLKNYRKQNNLTQDDLAEMLGYSQKNIAKWEQGFTLPPVDVLIELAKKMNLSLDDLLGLKEKTIFEKCVDFVIEKEGLNREEVLKFTDHEETIESIVKNNVWNIWTRYAFSIIEYDDFKDSIERNMTNEKEIAIEYLQEKGHLKKEKRKWSVSKEFALECIDWLEKFLTNDITIAKKLLADYKEKEKLFGEDKLEYESYVDSLQASKENLEKLLAVKESYNKKVKNKG